jgi:putative ribosome biogenesis GTPase RsgA
VPCGIKCLNLWFVLLIHQNIVNLTHNGNASVNVMVRCLVLMKMYGNKPMKLLNKINENSDKNRKVLPFLFLLLPKSVSNLFSLEDGKTSSFQNVVFSSL